MAVRWNPAYERVVRSALRGLPDHAPLDPDAPLPAFGLDSLGMVALAGVLEDEFAITLPDEAMVPATFATAGSLWSVVAGLRD
ncbi:phosphopantetheine-binding protein [Kitasatospora sp. NPDC056138]|uniref:phosphopantetheine-binding protein n=1 Tax=Kitasatospora sp. NPDC056138 TaxID=3345724 RepID=UPI0035D9FB15